MKFLEEGMHGWTPAVKRQFVTADGLLSSGKVHLGVAWTTKDLPSSKKNACFLRTESSSSVYFCVIVLPSYIDELSS